MARLFNILSLIVIVEVGEAEQQPRRRRLCHADTFYEQE